MVEQAGLKVGFLFIILVLTAIGGAIPLLIPTFRTNRFLSTLSKCFSAGIFLSVSLVHIIPQSVHETNEEVDQEIQLAYIFVGVGYALVLLLEVVFFGKAHKALAHVQLNEEVQPATNQINTANLTENQQKEAEDLQNSSVKQNKDPSTKEINKFSGLTLASALLVHSVIEGLALGISEEEEDVVTLGVAIAVHKLPAALALGIALKEQPKIRSLPLMATFVLSTPLGICIGMGLNEIEEPVITGILLAICAGSFIYCACSQIVSEEFHESNQLLIKYLAFVSGFTVFTVLSIIFHHDHEDEEDDHDHLL